MDTSRVSQGELIAGASGLLLFLFLFMDWFGPVSAFEAFDILDILLALIGLGTAAVVAARAMGMDVGLPAPTIFLEGFAASVIVLTFILEGEERKIGVWLALLAGLGIAYGGYMALTSGTRPTTTTPTPPPPAA